jgi:subtilisin-like proprotein convertase family protein
MTTRFWSILSVTAFLAGILLWREGNRRRDLAPPPPPAPPAATQTVHHTRLNAGPAVRLLTRVEDLHRQAAAARFADPELPHRLRNTDQPLAALARSDHAILLANALVDTARPEPLPVPPAWRAGAEPGAYVVQMRTPDPRAFQDAVVAAGGRVVSYIPNNAFLVRISAAGAERLAAVARAVLPFEPYFKVHASLLTRALAGEPPAAGERLAVTAFAEDREAVRAALTQLGVTLEAEGQTQVGPAREPQFVVRPGAAGLAALAALPGVQLIEPAPPRVLASDLTRERLAVTADTVVSNAYFDLTGSNVWVNLNDSGVDATHPDLAGRVFGTSTNALQDLTGHGTHLAGVIASTGAHGPTGTNVPPGSLTNASFRGLAPAAKLLVAPVDRALGPVSDVALQELLARTNYLTLARTNPLVSNNSWGYDQVFDYTSAAASYDAATRDALPDEPGAQPLLFVFSAGNNGGGNDSGSGGLPGRIHAPATAKNVITVGAVEQLRPVTVTVVQTNQVTNIVEGEFVVTNVVETNEVAVAFADSNDEVAPFSARGNVGLGVEGERGRFKPDVVAPGVLVVAPRAAGWTVDWERTNTLVRTFTNQLVLPDEPNRYSLLVPARTHRLTITTLPAPTSPVPFPPLEIYARAGEDPTAADFVGVTNAVIDAPAEGAWFYHIVNPTPAPVRFTLQVRLEVEEITPELLDLLRRINEPLAPHYRYLSGTSVAAAAVSGLLTLMQEFFEQRLQQPYSPALLKALLIHGARSLGPQYNLEVRSQINYQGWGLPALTNIFPAALTNALTDPEQWPVRWVDQSPTNALATGQTHAYDLEISTNATFADLRVTLVWTDPPANPAAAIKLVNDLDLVVSNRVTGQIYLGNDIPAGSDFNPPVDTNFTAQVWDGVNNVENVFLRGPVDTNYTIYVTARRVNVNAVTAHTNDIVQDYALVVSVGGTNALKFTPRPLQATNRAELTLMTNGVPLLYQRTGAHSPLVGGPAGTTNQWHFYVFTNAFDPNLTGGETNFGRYVAFLTFTPPNLSTPRTAGEGDIDLYVSRGDSNLVNLDPAALAAAAKSLDRSGTELVAFEDAALGEVFYVGVKAEDQMTAEYGLIALSSDQPFGNLLPDGSYLMYARPAPRVIPDGAPEAPGAALMFGVGVYPMTVGRALVYQSFVHEEAGDLLGNLSHAGRFVVLNNHSPIPPGSNGVYSAVYDDTGNAIEPLARRSDGPGSLVDFIGARGEGVWQFTMVDNAPGHTGRVESVGIRIFPASDLLVGTFVTLLPQQFEIFYVDVPADATLLRILLSQMTLPVDVLVRFDLPPSLTEFDKRARIAPPSGELTLGPTDVPPLRPGRYFVGVFNPNAVATSFYIRALIERGLAGRLQAEVVATNVVPIRDDVRMVFTNFVNDARAVAEVNVGLFAAHPRLSDLAFSLVSPAGTRTLLVENRGGASRTNLGYVEVVTNFHHVALTFSTNTGRAVLYLDGEAQAERDLGGFSPETRGRLYLGRAPEAAADPGQYLGQLDEVDLYARALEAPEIRGLYLYGGAAKPTNALVSRWSFEGNGDDAQGRNPALVEGPTYVPGRFGLGLNFAAEGDRVVITNQSGLDVGLAAGFTLDAWVNPADLSTNRILAAWGEGTNRLGVEFGFRPGADTNAPFGRLYANLRDRSGSNHVLEAVVQGLLRTNAFQTNTVYLTLTDDTNRTVVPIKFAEPDTAPTGRSTNRLVSSFEGPVTNRTTVLTNGLRFDGWEVTAGRPAVLNAPALAHTGTNLLALRDGALRAELTTLPGRTYRLEWAHRRQPLPPDLVSWWAGESNTTDRAGTNHGVAQSGLAYRPGKVGAGFYLGNAGYMRVPHHSTLSFADELTIELWYRVDVSYPPPGSSLLFKQQGGAVNYRVDLSTAGLDAGFEDPFSAGAGSDLPGGTEGVRLTPPPALNEFHHVAATWRQLPAGQVEMGLYLDGERRRAKVINGALSNAVNLGDLFVGLSVYRGVLDELTFYRRVLEPTEIRDIYLMDAVGKADPPGQPQTRVQIAGGPVAVFTSDADWQTNGLIFQAVSSNTLLEVAGLVPGALLDSFSVRELPATTFLPEEPLKPFVGQSALGEWKLEVVDRRVGATNDLDRAFIRWQLQFTFAPVTVPAVRLTNGVPYTNNLPAGQARYFIVDVPPEATRATNSVRASAGLDLWFNQLGLPTYGNSADDYRLLTNVTDAHAVLGTNGLQVLDAARQPVAAAARPVLQPGQRYYLALTNRTATTDFTIQVDFDRVVAAGPDVTPLARGQTLLTNIPAGNVLQYFQYVVSTNAVAASFELYPTNGDLNLYLRKAVPGPAPLPTPQVYDYAGQNPGAQPEIILVTQDSLPVPLSAGTWYLGVQNVHTQAVDYALRVIEYTNIHDRIIELREGIPATATVEPGLLSRLFFRYPVVGAYPAVQFDLTNLTGSAFLLARHGDKPTLSAYDFLDRGDTNYPAKLLLRTNALLPTLAGDWYLAVYNRELYPITFGVTASHPPAGLVVRPLTNNRPVRVTLAATQPGMAPELDFFSFTVGPAATNLTIALLPLNENADLLVRRGDLPDLATFDYFSANPDLEPESVVVDRGTAPVPLAPGEWYLAVLNNSLYSATYEVRVVSRPSETIGEIRLDPAVVVDASGVTIRWTAPPGLRFQVQYATSIPVSGPILWTPVPGIITSLDGNYRFTDDGSQTGGPAPFKIYRLLLLP